MELFKLNNSNNYKPGDSIKLRKDDSLIWTERYQDAGDFTLTVENDVSILNALPTGTLISHSDTREVMIVEDHDIERDEEKKLKVTVTGRSFETFAENRNTAGSESALYDGLDEAIVESLGPDDSASMATTLLAYSLADGVASAADEIPNLDVYSVMRELDDELTQVISRGDIYSRVLELIRLFDGGIKTIRPIGAETTMDLVVHDGINRIATVIFYANSEDLTDAKYFWTNRGVKNYVTVAGKYTARQVRDRNVPTDQTGLDRRVMYIAAEDLEGDYDPGAVGDVLDARGQSELSNHNLIHLIEATISPTAKPKFKLNYDVGDLVTVFGEFGTAQIMRVTSHILSIDKKGMRGYPSLSAL